MTRKRKEPTWWKTFDYLSGHTYILAEKFAEKGNAMGFATGCGMAVIAQSTVPITDEEREIAILKNTVKELRAEREPVFTGGLCEVDEKSIFEEQIEAAGWLNIEK